MKQLEQYQYCGHSVLMAKRKNGWQDTDKVLGMFGEKAGPVPAVSKSTIRGEKLAKAGKYLLVG